MRRLLLLCLLVMLPFQGARAALAGIAALEAPCAASQQAALHGAHGAHGGDADAQDGLPGHAAECEGTAGPTCCGTGCAGCHGHTLVALISAPIVLDTGGGIAAVARSTRGAPDHIPEHPLRPPLLHAV